MKSCKKRYIILAGIILLAVCIFSYNRFVFMRNKDVVIITDQSFFDSFSVEENEVRIKCTLSLENKSDQTRRVKITGDFKDDVDTGLLTERYLTGIFDDGTDEIVLQPGQSILYREVVFVGKYGGADKMSDRALPEMVLTVS